MIARRGWGLLLLVCGAVGAAEPPVPDGPRLKDIVAERYPGGQLQIGGTTGWAKRERGAGVVLDREFGYITPENDFKQHTVHPSPGLWDWSAADSWVEHGRGTGQVLRMHSPIGPQCSTWAKDDARTGEELRANLTEFLTALCQRFGAAEPVKWMDVVNETVLSTGQWAEPRPGTDGWENPWPTMGYDETSPLRPPLYLREAFAIAGREAPRIALIYNQNGSMQAPMWARVKAAIGYLREQGLRVDVVGWHAHVDVGWEQVPGNLDKLHDLIRWAHANALAFHVPEQTVWLKQAKDYDAQAATYAAIVGALLQHRGAGQVTWNTWNLGDGDPWARTRPYEGCLFAADYAPKPAYYAIQRVLLQPPAADAGG